MRDTLMLAGAIAMTVTQLAPSAVLAQEQPQVLPAPAVPQTQPVRPVPQTQPVRPMPQPQPVRPQPVRPMPQPQPVRPRPQPQPVRPLPAPVPDYGWNNGGWNGQTIRCESRNNRRNYCNADTRNGVRLVRQLNNTPCRQNHSWGYNRNSIWVDRGCRGEFQMNYGGGHNNNGGGGPSAGAVIGGVAVAAGLIALLANSNNNKSPPPSSTGNVAGPPLANAPLPLAANTGPARITAEMGGVTPSARPSLQTCLNDASRQIGATGGSEIRMDRIDEIEQGNGGYRFRFQLKATYPDETRTIATFCRATPTQVIELTFN